MSGERDVGDANPKMCMRSLGHCTLEDAPAGSKTQLGRREKKKNESEGGLVYQRAGMFSIFLCTPRAPLRGAPRGSATQAPSRVVRVPANWLMTVDSRKRISTGPSTVEEVMTSLHLT